MKKIISEKNPELVTRKDNKAQWNLPNKRRLGFRNLYKINRYGIYLRSDFVLKPGMVLAIEPMVNIGTEKTKMLPDGWTVITKDKSLSAHFEHTIALTESGPEILTAR